ncbi:S1 domain-containing post-transcriptional regulator GSP13 [Halalkalibacillus halophilus]|uniref:S1 domain-containing post-transcriptional regulator GSP13 n=1 Tax=Halalkalibacillus halophilus TaxID=392827 RepID=UPI0004213CBF|nr:S1 domain-containing post-transcriptional regulator GSP13 [Halalkalibacillus halophilus]
MTNTIEQGQVIEGKVTGIQSYGAFVEIAENKQGLVHISEITHGFVKDINQHLNVGDEVKVKVLDAEESKGKYSLSIRATEDKPKQQTKAPQQKKQASYAANTQEEAPGFNVLKDKLEGWIEQSKEREETYRR